MPLHDLLICALMNRIISKLIIPNKQQLSFILKVFFLFVTLIYSIKQESETNKCFTYAEYSGHTYSGFVVDLKDYRDLPFYTYYSNSTFHCNEIIPGDIKFWPDRSTLKFPIYYICNLSPVFLPTTQILKILQKKNICHKSSDDKPAPYLCC